MTRYGLCVVGAVALASFLTVHLPASSPGRAAAPTAAPPDTFQKYCFDCHGARNPEAGLSLEKLVGDLSLGPHWEEWEKVAEMLDTGMMPPLDADAHPSDPEREAAAAWIRESLKAYETKHAGEPGRVTIRRLTSAEYAYAIRDLTGVDLPVGIDASSDAVGGEGFANFGDVQFVQDETLERFLEAAKRVAEHAIVGAGPLEFAPDAGRTGVELFALHRISQMYETYGFRLASGEGGYPYGFDRYARAMYAAWHYRHRAALGEPRVTLRALAAREGITGRFAEHIWKVVNTSDLAYPARDMVSRWTRIPAPGADRDASVATARAGCDEIQEQLSAWPVWFFARGELAAGGAGDESPLIFDDETLKVEPVRRFTYRPGAATGRGRGGPSRAGVHRVYIHVDDVAPGASARPVVVWRNARLVTRAATPPGRGAAGAAALPAQAGRGGPGPVLSTEPLRTALAPDAAAELAFGRSPDGTPLGPDDFATDGPVSFPVTVREGTILELEADAELGADRDAVIRVMLSESREGTPRDGPQRVVLGDPERAGYRVFRANMAQYVSLLPPNSHGEANPADKDPVPAPFDNTYNSPEHDAFVLKVKYQRNDTFFTRNIVDGADRVRLDHAWNDLFGSWPYHDAYLNLLAEHFGIALDGRRITDFDRARIAALPAAAQPYVASLRAHYDEVMRAFVKAEPGHITDALDFASRAWRRPLAPAEQTALRAFYRRSRDEHGLDHDDALRAVLARVLVSPAFLYRVETLPRASREAPLNDWELASRMSFFLWSSIPDDELRRAAAAGELRKPDLLARQVARMTADPKARRLAAEFFGQWLGFYRFDEYRGVDTGRYPEFTDEIRAAMYDEALSTFEYLVREKRPVNEILHADYAFLSKPLAEFYGIEANVAASSMVTKVDGAKAFDRGGALRLGSVLTTTSAPLRTSPVKRGDWLLRRVLGTPTPPPPADAGTLPGDDKSFEGMTLRQRLESHKRDATCASCHVRIDPLGFPLEGFDAVGRTRRTYADGQPVDVTGEVEGERTLVGAEGLLQYLQGKDTQVLTTLSKKMLGYALGRTVLASDRPLLGDMTALGGDASFSDLAVRIVTSRQFRNHAGDAGAPAEPKAGSTAGAVIDPQQLQAGVR
jgi:mono/diheme cytochrome c family protein